jgi:hypothetical protein
MTRGIIIALLFLRVFHASAQYPETIPGEYVLVERIGLHSDGLPATVGNNSYLPRDPYADTTVFHKLCLNSTHGAFLERDTSFSNLYISYGAYKWIGNWELKEDSLLVTFDKLVVFYPFSISGTSSTIIVEKLSPPFVMLYRVGERENLVYLTGRKDYEFWDFEKKDSER